MIDEDILHVLSRIEHWEQRSTAHPDRSDFLPTHSNIWAGCYDVWHGNEDKQNQIQIPFAVMKRAEMAGLIKSELKNVRNRDYVVWSATDQGKAAYAEYLDSIRKINEGLMNHLLDNMVPNPIGLINQKEFG